MTYLRRGVALAAFVILSTLPASLVQAQEPGIPNPAPAAPAPPAPDPTAIPVAATPLAENPPPQNTATSPLARIAWGATLTSSWVDETKSTTFFFTPRLEAAYRFGDTWSAGAAWAFSWLTDNEGLSESFAKSGNPYVEGGFRQVNEHGRLYATLGFSIPIVTVPLGPDGRLHAFMVNQNLAMTGMQDAWFWLRDYYAVPLRVRYDFAISTRHRLDLSGALLPIIGIRSESSNVDVMGQARCHLRLAVTSNYELGLHANVVLLPSKGLDRLQVSQGIRVTRMSHRVYLDALVGIGKPNGFFGGMNRFGISVGKEFDL